MKPRLTIDQLQDSFIREVQLRRVVDGDTLDVYIENGFTQGLKENVRLSWVDTPEPRGPERPAGEWVAKKVQYWLKDEDILWLHSLRYDRDRYGRVLADIYKKNGENLNEWLIINSYAWPTDEDGSIIGSRDITRLNLPEGIINQVLTNQAT